VLELLRGNVPVGSQANGRAVLRANLDPPQSSVACKSGSYNLVAGVRWRRDLGKVGCDSHADKIGATGVPVPKDPLRMASQFARRSRHQTGSFTLVTNDRRWR
jgi:hypothetical protein